MLLSCSCPYSGPPWMCEELNGPPDAMGMGKGGRRLYRRRGRALTGLYWQSGRTKARGSPTPPFRPPSPAPALRFVCSVFESELADHIPVIKASIAGTRILGRLCVGNRNGLLLPHTTTDQELMHIRNCLPDRVVVQRVEERLSALGNCISTNDYVALVRPSPFLVCPFSPLPSLLHHAYMGAEEREMGSS